MWEIWATLMWELWATGPVLPPGGPDLPDGHQGNMQTEHPADLELVNVPETPVSLLPTTMARQKKLELHEEICSYRHLLHQIHQSTGQLKKFYHIQKLQENLAQASARKVES